MFVTLLAVVVMCNENPVLDNPCKGFFANFARDLKDCRQYFECSTGQAMPMICPKDYVFNLEGQRCFADNEENRKNLCFHCPRRGFTMSNVMYSCAQYVQCDEGRATLYSCSDNLVFDIRV